MRKLERALELASSIATWIAGAAVLLMALLGGLDILSTVVIGRPLAAAVEGTEVLMVIAAFMGLGLLHKRRAYIAVDLLREHSGRGLRRVLDWLTLLLMGGYFGLIAWRGWNDAFESLAVREFSNGLVQIPLYPSKFCLAIGMSIAVLWCIVELLKGGLFRDATPQPDP
ncbi:MAG TPA: TRAP transporter small permease [Burkholderiales bacterium]|jgi:TRAP-type C4-dicarboxylate transport system permease small subunit|nr:TRAP transporter small permease [Burkholderiales bacterium]